MKESKKRDHKNLKSRKDVIIPAPALRSQMPESYADFLKDLKERIRKKRLKVVLSGICATYSCTNPLGAYKIYPLQPGNL